MRKVRSNTALQGDLFEVEAARTLLDTLLTNSKLYRSSTAYKELLDFVARLRNFAPFNAMLLHVQKPGLSYAASAVDWWERFSRRPKVGARPLIILWPFGPVALVYDVIDTEGPELPRDVTFFPAHGPVREAEIAHYRERLSSKNILCEDFDAGDRSAGSIRRADRGERPNEHDTYKILLNRNYAPPVRFTTLVHELAHLFLGHLGPDRALNISGRTSLHRSVKELEAESVAYLVCARNNVVSHSETYLANFASQSSDIGDLEIYRTLRAAGQIETVLGLGAQTRFNSSRGAR